MNRSCALLISLFCISGVLIGSARELHVAISGEDSNGGSRRSPLRTIQKAAELAQPGDTITVHGGTYRERINPPRGGTSEKNRITFQAAKGEKVVIKGSEVVKGWSKAQDDVWRVVLPNSMFGAFNPFKERIRGDWFDGKGRQHHLGAVYVDGDWLIEAAKKEEVFLPVGSPISWLGQGGQGYLLNVAWFKAGDSKIQASRFAAQKGVQTAPCSEGGDCIGWIEAGDWVRYENVTLGSEMELRVSSATEGGRVEVRANSPDGELLGNALVPSTGDWQSWTTVPVKLKPSKDLQAVYFMFHPRRTPALAGAGSRPGLWFAEVNENETTVYAQFSGFDPNQREVEVNVRPAVFYPEKTGINFITVRGFHMHHAATQWAPPTAEQIDVIVTHCIKGRIIENNVISHSISSGIALGKHGDEFDNTSENTAEGYVITIERAFKRGWNRETIGHHVVRNNTISHCEQTGIVGSMGCAFSTVTGNVIHDIHVRQLFTGAEMAGIKFHAAIDTVISNNHIYRTCLGLWLDWMAQGTRVSANLFHDNGRDLFMEVNHGPFLIDNNVFLSNASLLDVSEGGAYVHNLFNGTFVSAPEPNRETPYHPEHTTALAGLARTTGGDNRFYNNIFIGRGDAGGKPSSYGIAVYDQRPFPLQNGGNVFYNGSQPYGKDNCFVLASRDPELKLEQDGKAWVLNLRVGEELGQAQTKQVDTTMLGKAKVPNLPYEKPDGSPLVVDRDFFGKKRDASSPLPGPFEGIEPGKVRLTLRK